MTAIINSCLVLLYTAVGHAVQQPTGQHVSKEVFFYGATAAYQKSQSAVFMLPEKSVPSAVIGTVHRLSGLRS